MTWTTCRFGDDGLVDLGFPLQSLSPLNVTTKRPGSGGNRHGREDGGDYTDER
jgi:hypothetical protein